MEKLTFLLLPFFLFACVKTHERITPQRETLSVSSGNTVITNIIDNNIKTDVINGSVETITLNNGVIITRTKDLKNSELFHITKIFPDGRGILFNQFVKVSSGITTVSLFYLTGVKCFSVDINQSGGMNNLFVDTNLQASSCLSKAISICIHSWACTILCTAGGWGGCIMGWIGGCATGNL